MHAPFYVHPASEKMIDDEYSARPTRTFLLPFPLKLVTLPRPKSESLQP
jgi:hypothetical protein